MLMQRNRMKLKSIGGGMVFLCSENGELWKELDIARFYQIVPKALPRPHVPQFLLFRYFYYYYFVLRKFYFSIIYQ